MRRNRRNRAVHLLLCRWPSFVCNIQPDRVAVLFLALRLLYMAENQKKMWKSMDRIDHCRAQPSCLRSSVQGWSESIIMAETLSSQNAPTVVNVIDGKGDRKWGSLRTTGNYSCATAIQARSTQVVGRKRITKYEETRARWRALFVIFVKQFFKNINFRTVFLHNILWNTAVCKITLKSKVWCNSEYITIERHVRQTSRLKIGRE